MHLRTMRQYIQTYCLQISMLFFIFSSSLLCYFKTHWKPLHSLTEPCLAQISAATAFWLRSDTGNPPRHRIGVIGAECWDQLRLPIVHPATVEL